MNTTTAFDMAKRMSEQLLDYGPDRSRLLIRVMRLLAQGNPVDGKQVDRIIADLGIGQAEANQFLRQITERDAEDRIVGIMGLSLNDHPHRFVVNRVELATWCAEDTLFLPAMLEQTATVESASPVSNQNIYLTISPQASRRSALSRPWLRSSSSIRRRKTWPRSLPSGTPSAVRFTSLPHVKRPSSGPRVGPTSTFSMWSKHLNLGSCCGHGCSLTEHDHLLFPRGVSASAARPPIWHHVRATSSRGFLVESPALQRFQAPWPCHNPEPS